MIALMKILLQYVIGDYEIIHIRNMHVSITKWSSELFFKCKDKIEYLNDVVLFKTCNLPQKQNFCSSKQKTTKTNCFPQLYSIFRFMGDVSF